LKRPSIFALALLLLAVAVPAQKAVFVVRHAEKAAEGSDPDIPLSDAGDQRAERLAVLLQNVGITAIYSTDTVRTRATAQPLAAALHLPVRIYDGKNPQALREALRAEPQAIALVVGHSNTVPDLLSTLGIAGKIKIADADYDDLFVVVPRPAEAPVLLRLKY